MKAQVHQALALANEIRTTQCRIIRQIRDGEASITAVLADPPAELARVPVARLLRAQRRWGDQRVHRLCAQVAINENRPVGKLTARQRGLLITELHFANTQSPSFEASGDADTSDSGVRFAA